MVFSVVNGPAVLSGNTLRVTAAGTVIVRADQPGNIDYSPASPVERSFRVLPAPVGPQLQSVLFSGLLITGEAGASYRILSCTNLAQATWTQVDTVTLTNSQHVWIDPRYSLTRQCYYRAVSAQ